MKTILQCILVMETNELPSEAFNLGNVEIKSSISVSEKGVHFGLGKDKGGERPLVYKIYLESEFPVGKNYLTGRFWVCGAPNQEYHS